MGEKKIKWTEQQRRAIVARGSNVLVTASAGTGKTAVMSGRCVDIVSEKSGGPDVLGMLVLTFTNAAAEQMRSRIAEQLRSAYAESKDPHLRRQLILLDGADIGTIHSFCRRLVSEHFYKLGLDPAFVVIESDEQKLLKAEVLEDTIEWAWQQAGLRDVLEQLLYRRDLRTADGFLSNIETLSDFLDGVVWRESWCERVELLADAADPFTTELGKKQKQIVANKLQDILRQLRHAQNLCRGENPGSNWIGKSEEDHIKPVVRCVELLEAGDWDGCADAIREFDKPKVYPPKDLSEMLGRLVKRIVKEALDDFEGLKELAILNPDYLDRVGTAVGLQTKAVIELVRRFDRLYSRAKRAVNCLDFADLEHYALKLLADENSAQDNLLPSETALALRRKYRYIFVDEYQDINPVQQAILRLLGSEGNVFVVGDVKQSIYAFRGAEPKIFITDLKSASTEPAGRTVPLRVDLTANWRCDRGILDFVNKVFSRIMTASFADVDYDESARLRPASDVPKDKPAGGTGPVVELHILDKKGADTNTEGEQTDAGDEQADIISGRQRQAAMIARRIRQMVGADTGEAEFQIYDKRQDKARDVEYRDIVILMRSPAKRVNDYVEVLRLAGVPVSCEAAGGYFEETEISDFISLLKVLDNPRQDIELAAVLRSPFFKISDTELAKIKIHSGTEGGANDFYDCVLRYRDDGADGKLAGRLKEVLEQIGQWRMVARRGNLADLIWQVCRQSGFLSFVSALPNGRTRRANILKLHERAIQFEGFASSAGVASLTRFVGFMEKLRRSGGDWTSAEPEAEAENAVRIISVHKSKGLEFPVVFLAELHSRFNRIDLLGDFLAGADDTLGLQIIDCKSNSKISSLAHQVIAEQKLATSLAEEMRILYVAMTRAGERLILSACEGEKHCRDIITNGVFFGDKALPDWQLRRCQSHLDWLLYGLCDQKNLHDAFETGLAQGSLDNDLFRLKLYDAAEIEGFSGYISRLKNDKARRSTPSAKKGCPRRQSTGHLTAGQLLSQVKDSLGRRYRFGNVSLLPAKQSVTQLTHRSDEYVRIDYSGALQRLPSAIRHPQAETILSGQEDLAEQADGRVIGTAAHLVIARFDLSGDITEQAVERTKRRLLADGAMTEAVAERIKSKSIAAFFKSEPGLAVFEKGNTVWREWPFTFALPVSEFPGTGQDAGDTSHEPPLLAQRQAPATSDQRPATSDELIVVQGIIDMLVKTPEGLIVIDFKTDNVSAGQAEKRAELYREQLDLYSRAAGAILKDRIAGKWLYFLEPAVAFEL